MARNQEDGITIPLGLKDYKVEQVREDEDRVVVKVMLERREKKYPYRNLTRLYRHGKCSIAGAMAEGFTFWVMQFFGGLYLSFTN